MIYIIIIIILLREDESEQTYNWNVFTDYWQPY